MIMQVKPVLGIYKMKDGRGETKVIIRQQKIFSPAKLILRDNTVVYMTGIGIKDTTRYYFVTDSRNEMIVQSELEFEQTRGITSILRPPKVSRMVLKTPYGEWEAEQGADLSVLFASGGTVIGKLSPFYSIRPQVLACSDEYPPVFWAALYVLAFYMVHESDVLMV